MGLKKGKGYSNGSDTYGVHFAHINAWREICLLYSLFVTQDREANKEEEDWQSMNGCYSAPRQWLDLAVLLRPQVNGREGSGFEIEQRSACSIPFALGC